MKHVDDGDLFAIEAGPEWLSGGAVVNHDFFGAHNNYSGSLHQKDFSFIGMGGERIRVHSQAIVCIVIVDANDKEHQLLLCISGGCKFKSDSKVLRSRSGALKLDAYRIIFTSLTPTYSTYL